MVNYIKFVLFLFAVSLFAKEKEPEIYKYRPSASEAAFYAHGAFLYWRTLEDGVDYAIKGQPNTATPTGAIGDYKVGHYDWDPGFRVALGYRFKPYFHEIEAEWTYFHNSGSDSSFGPSTIQNGMLVGTFAQPFSAGSNSANRKATSDLDLHYNVLNIYLGSTVMYQDHMIFRFFVGPTGAWIDQDWTVKYFSSDNDEVANVDWDYHAGGLRFGMSNEWYIKCGFGIVSQLSFGGYVGSYDNHEKIVQTFKNPARTITRQDTKLDETRFAFNPQFLIGLKWGKVFQSCAISLYAAYEINPWFNLHMVNRALLGTGADSRISNISDGIFTPQGLNLNFSFSF